MFRHTWRHPLPRQFGFTGISASEEIPDMFVGWVYSRYDSTPRGAARANYMIYVMTRYVFRGYFNSMYGYMGVPIYAD